MLDVACWMLYVMYGNGRDWYVYWLLHIVTYIFVTVTLCYCFVIKLGAGMLIIETSKQMIDWRKEMYKILKKLRQSAYIWFVNRYRIQLIVPEYKAYHVCKNLTEMLQWSVCYPADADILIVYPSVAQITA